MSGEPAPAAQVPSEAESEEHRAGWFELFFDLVFVVTVAVLAQGLHGNPSAADFGTFLVLFFPAWWAWANLMVTVNVLGSGVPRIQAMLLGAMPGLGLMAAAAPDGLGNRAWAYALGAAWVRLVFFVIWWGQVRRPDEVLPQWRPLLYGLVPALLWAVSAVVPGPGRFVLWGAAMALEVALLAITSDPSAVLYEQLSAEHLVERISLFVVIVLGESVFTVVATLAGHFVRASALAALLGFVVVAELAMVFFLWGTTAAARGLDRAQAGRANRAIRDTVMYLPFVLIAGITVLSGALGTAVAEPVHHLPPGAAGRCAAVSSPSTPPTPRSRCATATRCGRCSAGTGPACCSSSSAWSRPVCGCPPGRRWVSPPPSCWRWPSSPSTASAGACTRCPDGESA